MTNNKPIWRWYGSRDGEIYHDLPDGVSSVEGAVAATVYYFGLEAGDGYYVTEAYQDRPRLCAAQILDQWGEDSDAWPEEYPEIEDETVQSLQAALDAWMVGDGQKLPLAWSFAARRNTAEGVVTQELLDQIEPDRS
jgi:hypothetical protein